MKNLVLVLTNIEHTLELIGVFPHTYAAMEFIWSQQIDKEFPASPIGDTDGNHTGVHFIENLAEISLRETPAPSLSGLGALNYSSVWVRQQNQEGPIGLFVATFVAADHERTHGPGALRWAKFDGVLTFAHISSALGQTIEETVNTKLARDVQKTMLVDGLPNYSLADARATQTLHEFVGTTVGPRSSIQEHVDNFFICEGCEVAAVPGAIFPIASNGSDEHAYIEVCDTCRIFELDVQAAKAVSIVFGKPLKLDGAERPYLEGITFDEAEELAKSKQRPPPPPGVVI